MIAAALVALAVYALAGQQITERLKTLWTSAQRPRIDGRHVAGVALLVAAAISFLPHRSRPAPGPMPVPPDAFSLRGKFVGPTAADDAQMLSALLGELADCIERDGTLTDPRLKTGVAFDDLRIAAREARMRGESLGARQPAVRDAIHQFLDQAVGTSGGPVTPESRRAWVAAYRDLSDAAAEATR